MTAAFQMNARALDFLATLSLDHGKEFDKATYVPEFTVGFDTDGWSIEVYVPGHEVFSTVDQPSLEHVLQEALHHFGSPVCLLRGPDNCPDRHPYVP